MKYHIIYTIEQTDNGSRAVGLFMESPDEPATYESVEAVYTKAEALVEMLDAVGYKAEATIVKQYDSVYIPSTT